MGTTMGVTASSVGTRAGRRIVEFVLPALVVIAMIVALVLLLRGLLLLGSWSSTYDSTGELSVASCEPDPGRFGGPVICEGQLVPDENPEPIGTVMQGPKAAFGSELPRPGSRVDVYYETGDTGEVYPVAGRGTEVARAGAGVIPFVFIVGGLVTWLVGWAMTRNISRRDAERWSDLYRWPQRFVLRPRGALWALVGFGWLAVDRLFIDRLLGSANLG